MTAVTLTSTRSITTIGGTATTAVVPGTVTLGYTTLGSGAQVEAVDITGTNDVLNNYGALRGQVGVKIEPAASGAIITNHSGGVIYAGAVGTGPAVYAKSYITLVNAGLITQALGSDLAVYIGQGARVTNLSTGVISANTNAIYGHSGGALPTYVLNYGSLIGQGTLYGAVGLASGGTVVNKAGGVISAPSATYGVYISGGVGTVTNAGTINNGVTLASNAANRVIVDPGAVFTGAISGGGGTLELATGTGTLATTGSITNFGTTTLDVGSSWVIKGGAGLGGGLGTISGFTATDTIQVTGHETIAGQSTSGGVAHVTLTGASAMTLNFAGTLATLSATYSAGVTNLSFQAGPSILNYGTTLVQSGVVATSETVSAGGILTLFNAGSTAVGTINVGTSLSTPYFLVSNDGTNSTVVLDTVFGTYASGVTLLTNPTTIAATGKATNTAANGKAVSGPSGTGWTLVNKGLVSETASGGIGVSLAQSGSIINNAGGIITAAGGGVVLAGGGVVTNASGGRIAGYSGISAAAAATVVNTGSIAGLIQGGAHGAGVSLSGGGQVTNQAGGTITGLYGVAVSGAAGTVQNLGIINALIGGLGYIGVVLSAGGTIINGTSGGTASAAYITGYTAIQFGASGTLINYGTLADGGQNVVQMPTGVVINGPSGDIGARIAVGGGSGVAIAGAGTVLNYATIVSTNYGSYSGVSLGGGGIIKNLGSASVIEGYVAVYAQGGATVTNAGTITTSHTERAGAAALEFGTGTNRLIVNSGAKFIGTVSGAGTATGASTLEFASTAAAGTIGGLGTQFVNFPQITIDSGARWSITGSNSIATGVTLTNSGTDTVIGSLVNAGRVTATGTSPGVYVGAGGFVSNQSGGTIAAYAGVVVSSSTGTLVNSGRISGVSTGSGTGVKLANGGSFTNNASGTVTGDIGVYATGASAATIVNAGSINGQGGGNNGVALLGGGIFTNLAGGTVTNGVFFLGAAGTLVNAGYITGTHASVSLTAGGTVVNQSGGTLKGSLAAVQFTAGRSARVIDAPGAVFIGKVEGGNTIGAASISTLELASGAATGTLSGLGAQFTHFAQVTIDGGAAWNLSRHADRFLDAGQCRLGSDRHHAGHGHADRQQPVQRHDQRRRRLRDLRLEQRRHGGKCRADHRRQ